MRFFDEDIIKEWGNEGKSYIRGIAATRYPVSYDKGLLGESRDNIAILLYGTKRLQVNVINKIELTLSTLQE